MVRVVRTIVVLALNKRKSEATPFGPTNFSFSFHLMLRSLYQNGQAKQLGRRIATRWNPSKLGESFANSKPNSDAILRAMTSSTVPRRKRRGQWRTKEGEDTALHPLEAHHNRI